MERQNVERRSRWDRACSLAEDSESEAVTPAEGDLAPVGTWAAASWDQTVVAREAVVKRDRRGPKAAILEARQVALLGLDSILRNPKAELRASASQRVAR